MSSACYHARWYDPLAELSERILDSADGPVINLIYVLCNSKCAHLTDDSCEEAQPLLCVIPHDVELVGELRKNRFDSLSRLAERLVERFPIFLVASIRHLQADVCRFELVELQLHIDISSVSDDSAVEIILLHIVQIINVMYTRLGQVVGVDNS